MGAALHGTRNLWTHVPAKPAKPEMRLLCAVSEFEQTIHRVEGETLTTPAQTACAVRRARAGAHATMPVRDRSWLERLGTESPAPFARPPRGGAGHARRGHAHDCADLSAGFPYRSHRPCEYR